MKIVRRLKNSREVFRRERRVNVVRGCAKGVISPVRCDSLRSAFTIQRWRGVCVVTTVCGFLLFYTVTVFYTVFYTGARAVRGCPANAFVRRPRARYRTVDDDFSLPVAAACITRSFPPVVCSVVAVCLVSRVCLRRTSRSPLFPKTRSFRSGRIYGYVRCAFVCYPAIPHTPRGSRSFRPRDRKLVSIDVKRTISARSSTSSLRTIRIRLVRSTRKTRRT